MKQIKKISVSFYGIAKGRRQAAYHRLDLAEIERERGARVTPDELNQYEREAWYRIEESTFRGVASTATLQVYSGTYDPKTDILMVMMMPDQQQTIMR